YRFAGDTLGTEACLLRRRRSKTCTAKSKYPNALLLRQKCLRLSDLGPIGVGFCAHRNKLRVVGPGFLPITGLLRRTSRSVEPPVAVRVLLERGLELSERRSRLPCLQQQLSKQLAHRIEAVLHRHVLDTAIFAIRSRTHELYGLFA